MRIRIQTLLSLTLLASAALLPAQTPAPANPNLTPTARRVLTYIQQQQGVKMLSGQEETSGQLTSSQQTIITRTGKRPAIRGWDVRFQNPNPMTEAANSWNNYRQLVQFSWHMGVPPNGPMTDADDTFDSSQSTISAAVMNEILTPGTTRYNNLIAKLDKQAARLKVLADADIPVLWRPWHEAEGDGGNIDGWFWWSSTGHTDLKRLWNLMYDYFTYTKGLNNLIWVYGGNKDPMSAGTGTGLDWYPGDNRVDIIGTDSYVSGDSYATWKSWYDKLGQIGGSKPRALTECDLIPEPGPSKSNGFLYVWFLTWTGTWLDENSNSRLSSIYNSADTITADELPDLRGSSGGDTTSPSVPSGMSASNITSTSFTLSWTASSDNVGVTGYEVFRNGTSIGTTTSTSKSVTGLTSGTTYGMTVRAYDAAGNSSAQSATTNVTTTATAGTVTVNDATVGTGTNQFNFSGTWNTSTGTSKYNGDDHYSSTSGSYVTIAFSGTQIVFRGAKASHHGIASVSIDGGTAVSVDTYSSTRTEDAVLWTSPTLASGAHTLRIQVSGTKNASSTGTTISVDRVDISNTTTSDTTAPSVPTGLASSNVTNTSLTVSWNASTDNVGVTGYEVFRNGISIGTTTSTSKSVTGLTAASTHSFTVRARDAAGNWSAQSSALSVTTTGTPTNLVTNGTFESGSLTPWTGTNVFISGVAFAGTSAGRVGTSGGSGGTIQQTISGLSPSTTYTVTAQIKLSATGSSATLGVDGYGGSSSASAVTGTSWTQKTITFTTGASATSARIYMTVPANSGQLGYVDNVTLF